MSLFGTADAPPTPEARRAAAITFMQAYNADVGETAKAAEEAERLDDFEPTEAELDWACKAAWRNAPRCPGRIQWRNLKLFDCRWENDGMHDSDIIITDRNVTELEEAFAALCEHVRFSTNGGNIRPAVTVFPARVPGRPDKLRIWNAQLIQYAGYAGGIGDKANLQFTEVRFLTPIEALLPCIAFIRSCARAWDGRERTVASTSSL